MKAYVQPTSQAGDIELCALSALGKRRFEKSARVAIEIGRVPLRGTMLNLEDELHYTLDGSEPTAASPRYEQPITLDKTTTVRALLMRDRKPFMTTSTTFEKGP